MASHDNLLQLQLTPSLIEPSEEEGTNESDSDTGQDQVDGSEENLEHATSLFALSQVPVPRLLPPPSNHQTPACNTPASTESAPGSMVTTPNDSINEPIFPQTPSGGTNYHPSANSGLGLNVSHPEAQSLWSTAPSYNFLVGSTEPLNGVSHAIARPVLDHSYPAGTASTTGIPNLESTRKSPKPASSIRQNYMTSVPGLHRHFDHKPATSMERSSSNLPLDTPQPVLPSHTGMAFSTPALYGSSYSATQSTAHNATTNPAAYHHPSAGQTHHARSASRMHSPSVELQHQEPPFREQKTYYDIQTGDGQRIRPQLVPRSERGFFWSVDGWTSYRRNYFTVNCSYQLDPFPGNRSLYLIRRSDTTPSKETYEQIQAFAIGLSAAVDGTAGKKVDLIQHTPKRDRGPQAEVQRVKICPLEPGATPSSPHIPEHHGYPFSYGVDMAKTPPQIHVNLPMQAHIDPFYLANPEDDAALVAAHNPTSPYATSHTFERVQFRNATANNGKRRAQQQYFHINVDLWADVRRSENQPPKWQKIASRSSPPVVVRGRSPSHYLEPGSCTEALGDSSSGTERPSISNMGWAAAMHTPPSAHSWSAASGGYGGHGQAGFTATNVPQLQPPLQRFVSISQEQPSHAVTTLPPAGSILPSSEGVVVMTGNRETQERFQAQARQHARTVQQAQDAQHLLNARYGPSEQHAQSIQHTQAVQHAQAIHHAQAALHTQALQHTQPDHKFQYWPLELVEQPPSRVVRSRHHEPRDDDLGHYYQHVPLST